VYFQPLVNADNRRLWVHLNRVDTNEFEELAPVLGTLTWTRQQLAWALFILPPGRFNTTIGRWEGGDAGVGLSIGPTPE
jgi:hypothetical protein